MKCTSITNEEKASTGGFTHRLDFSYADIPVGVAIAGANTVWPITLPSFKVSDIMVKVELHLTTPFAVSPNDAAFISTTISLGDTGSATRFISASEANINGTEVLDVIPGASQNYVYTAASQLVLTVGTATAGKTISSLNIGQGYILLSVNRAADMARVKATPFGSGQT